VTKLIQKNKTTSCPYYTKYWSEQRREVQGGISLPERRYWHHNTLPICTESYYHYTYETERSVFRLLVAVMSPDMLIAQVKCYAVNADSRRYADVLISQTECPAPIAE